ncbi:MAG: pyridoxamine 5'-phosphate oxidase family protein [Chloroflexota bacterium]|nr:MAG: pyridoxamine 5'-phosphate oxidase family protein [Chloroflexota bacterium]
MSTNQLRRSIEDLLDEPSMTLATKGESGDPHAAAVYFVSDEQINLYFFSDPDSQHAQDNARDPRAAVAINGEHAGWREIHGLQMRGLISSIDESIERQDGWILYKKKFPFVIDLEEIILMNQMYVFKPQWIRLIDNRIEFGYKKEWVKTTTVAGAINQAQWRLTSEKQEIFRDKDA